MSVTARCPTAPRPKSTESRRPGKVYDNRLIYVFELRQGWAQGLPPTTYTSVMYHDGAA
jgi:hypothetical protein